MTKVYALFDSNNKIVSIGLNIDDVTSFSIETLSSKDWNTWFDADTANEEREVLEKNGYYVKVGEFKALE